MITFSSRSQLLHRRHILRLRVVRRGHEFLDGILSVVVVVAQVFGTLVGGYGAVAVAFAVIGIAHLDVRPNGQPCRAEVAAERGLEIIDGKIVVTLFQEQQAEMVIDPRIRPIKL